MKRIATAVVGAVCVLSFAVTSASAEIACNREGDCWHVKERHEYHREWGVEIHPDNWKWEERDHRKYHWREHEGRGYWHDGAWIEF